MPYQRLTCYFLSGTGNSFRACLRCAGFCKQHAIEASHLWLLLLIVVTTLLAAEPLRRQVGPLVGVALPELVWQLGSLAATYLAVLALYYVFWGLQRLRPVHALLGYLTWTRYFHRRYHDPETQQKELQQGVRGSA